MILDDYQTQAATTAVYDDAFSITYPALGLFSEAGEIAGKLKKGLRDNDGIISDELAETLALELGDVLWYVAMLAADLGFTLDEIARANLAKLADRQDRGVIQGSGDNR